VPARAQSKSKRNSKLNVSLATPGKVRGLGALTLSVLAALAVSVPVAAGAGGHKRAVASSRALRIDGSTSIFPLMTQLAAAWHNATHEPTPRVGQGTSDVGVSDAHAGRVDIGDVSRDPEEGDPAGLVFTKIARDGVCMVTNPRNRLANLS
jgi:phosphate transport system substrate-binding protein